MKRVLFVVILFFSFLSNAQLFNIDHLIDTDIGYVSEVKSGDFDNDGDQDLFTISSLRLVWYENLDGNGNFGEAKEIDGGMGQSFNQLVVDLDQDGWKDIIISYFDQDFIAYYRNLGSGTFAPFVTLASNLNEAAGIASGDLDGDGDLDLVLGLSNSSGFYWMEQLSLNTFGPLIAISTSLTQARNQVLGDIDGDGDLDILSNGLNPLMSWFENTNGQGDFSVIHIIDDTAELYENYFHLVDIDKDGDLDNVSNKINEILWRENLDGLGNFGTKQVIFSYSDNTPDLASVYTADLDNDGDIDVTYDSGFDLGKVYHLNTDGQGTFGPINIIDPPEGGTSGNNLPVDIDGDGDIDLMNTSLNVVTNINDLYWYENLTILGVRDARSMDIKIYPNPVKDVLVIESSSAIYRVSIFTILGNKLLEITQDFNEIPMAKLPTGLLLVEITTAKGKVTEKVLKH